MMIKINYKMKIILLAVYILISLFKLVNCNGIGSPEPPKIEQHPNSVIVNASDPVTFECRASGEPKPKISWFKDGQKLNLDRTDSNSISKSKYTLIHDSNLFIFSATLGKLNKSDSGVYYCMAENEYGQAISSNASLLIAFLKDDFRDVPKSRQVNAGIKVMMDCRAPRGSPEPTISWEKNGIRLSLPVENQFKQPYLLPYALFSNGTLAIFNTSIIDNGEYVCVARNDAGEKKSQPALLNVFEKPFFVVKPENSKYELNARAELRCQAEGFPKPQIEWRKDNSVDNLPSKALIRDNLLIIPHVQLEDEGEYQCVATNQLSSIESKAYLIVNERPKFVKTMSNLTIGIDSKSIILECNARGKPQPVIYWAKSNIKPQNYDTSSSDLSLPSSEMTVTQDDFLILENGNLFIERLSRKYEGTYLCQASNEYGNIETKTYLKVKPIQSKPPPIIIYGPQNQTIPINTQANLECLASTGSNIINKDSSFKQQRPFNIQSAYSNDKITVTWYKGTQEIISNPFNENGRFKIAESGALEISAVQKSDTGVYKCVTTNGYGRTTSMPALLTVENPNNQYVEFQRAYESTTLPSAPTQPIISSITSNSLVISWQPSSHSGHSPLKSYTIEYFSPEWPLTTGWTILADNVSPVNSFLIENLQSDTYYMFIVRARNEQGFGPPSQVSDLVKTLVETQILLRSKDSNDLLEKALTGEIIQLNEQPDVLSSTSINITWKIYKSAFLLEGIYLKYKPIGVKDYQIEVLNEKNPNYINRASYYVIKNLNKFTTYEILLEPFIGDLKGSESNVIQVKTKEDVPSQIPLNLQADIESLNSLSIKWQPPHQQHMNGIIMGYKIMGLANETKYGINLNTNASSRAIILGNLIHGVRYCIKVAAFTKTGTGPFTPSRCIDMTEENLAKTKENNSQKNKINQQFSVPVTFNDKLKFLMKQSWFISLLTIVCILAACLIFYCLWMSLRRLFMSPNKKHQKYLSSSENCSSLNLGNHKIDTNGNRYKLVNDTIWLDTMYSSKNSNQDCCCVPDLPHQLFLHNNNGNLQLINNNQLSTLDRRNIHNMSLNSKSLKINNNIAPQYAEIYAAALQQQQGANPYATTGLFMNGTATTTTDSENAYNICDDIGGETQVFLEKTNSNVINSPANLRAAALNLNPKYSSYTLKVIDDSNKLIRNDLDLANKLLILNAVPSNQSNNSILINDQKKLIKYLQATQSQTNTPRIQLKNMQNRVKSVEQQQHQQILDYQNQVNNLNTFLAASNNNNNNNNLSQNTNNSGVPSLPSVPPPSLSTAFIAAQQELLNSSSNNGTQSPVLYNSPWNVGSTNENNLNSILLTHLIQNNPNPNSTMNNNKNSNLQIPKVYQMNTLASSTFTSQQYANNRRNDNKPSKEPQTDYLSISPDEDEYEEDVSSNNTNSYYPIQSPHQKFVLATAAANGTKMKIANQKPIQLINHQPTTGSSGSYDSSTNQNTCSSSDSSILSASKHSTNQSNNDYHIVYSDQLNNQLV